MGYAAVGLLGIGIGLRVGLFGLLTLSLCILFGIVVGILLFGLSDGFVTSALGLALIEAGALAGMMLRYGLFERSGEAAGHDAASSVANLRQPTARAPF